MQTKLKKLTLRACRSFSETATVTFSDSGLVLIRGKNIDTGGSSGSGKSSLLLALSYAFGFAPFAATTLQSWHTEEPLEVEVEFEVDGKVAVLRRGAKTSLTVDGQTIKGSVKTVEEALQRLIGLAPELLQALTYRAQRQRSAFLAMPDADKKEFLSHVLGLERIETLVDEATKKAKAMDLEIANAQGEVAGIKLPLSAAKEQLQSAAVILKTADAETELASRRSQTTFLDEQRAKLQMQAASISSQIQDTRTQAESKYSSQIWMLEQHIEHVKSRTAPPSDTTELDRLSALLMEVKTRMQSAEARDEERKREHEATWLQLQADCASATASIQMSKAVQEEIDSIKSRLEKLSHNTCPTCSREWNETAAEEEKLQKELESCLADMQQINAARQLVVDLQQKLQFYPTFKPSAVVEQFRQLYEHTESELATEKQKHLEQVHSFKTAQLEDISRTQEKIISIKTMAAEAAESAMSVLTNELQSVQTKLDHFLSEIREHETRCSELQAQLAEAQNRQKDKDRLAEQVAQLEKHLTEAQARLDALKARQTLELDIAHSLGREGFLGSIFDEILVEIAEEANDILAAVPNTASVSFSFKTETLTQKGTAKKSIVPTITVAGHEAPMASGLSGGMSTSVELAVDLAIGSVIARRSGTNPGWLLLDEAFEGLGLVEKEACLEILQRFAQDRLILVVDHDNQFKELFQSTIDVQCQNGKSNIAQ